MVDIDKNYSSTTKLKRVIDDVTNLLDGNGWLRASNTLIESEVYMNEENEVSTPTMADSKSDDDSLVDVTNKEDWTAAIDAALEEEKKTIKTIP